MKNRLICHLLLVLAVVASACNSWLDVQPRTKIKSDDLFKTEQGFKDALTGVYTLMKAEALYGRELSFGFVDVVAGPYATYNNTIYNDVAQWKFLTSQTVRSQIDNIWCKMYNLLANVNHILDQIDARQSVFTQDNYNLIKGEALGLRAYIHFDLLRLFASADLSKEAIPYVQKLQIEVPEVYTGKECIGLLNGDIKLALTCLANDPIREGKRNISSDDDFMNNRPMHLNYFAVKALEARVAMWANDVKTAKEAATEILAVADDVFPWITTDAISATDDKDRDFTFSTEQVFALHVNELKDIATTYMLTIGNGKQLYSDSYGFEQRFEKNGAGANDYRIKYIAKYEAAPLYGYVARKYFQPEKYKADYAKRLPMIRRSELDLMMAECLIGEDNATALQHINNVRRHRGILADLTDVTKVREELTKEYCKEFYAEGQLFYYCKRNQMKRFPFGYTDVSEKVYVLPKPDLETEFGDYYAVDNGK